MKLFICPHCSLLLFFENRQCGRCGHVVGFIPSINQFSAVESAPDGLWQTLAAPGQEFKSCDNVRFDACNWLIPAGSPDSFCTACRHNHMVPDLSDAKNLHDWRKMEFAKHRLFYTLLQLKMPLRTRAEDPIRGLAFDFLADSPTGESRVLTGHNDGIITLALKEADDAEREARRTAMYEPYRTLLGHFRHEIGHYYWDMLVDDGHRQDECRALFGDDRQDYDEALKRYYSQGASPNWQDYFVSAYATSHPWEDFAETWAHYLHIVDSLETSSAFGLKVHPGITSDRQMHAEALIDPYSSENFDRMIETWLPLTYAMNAMNRSMGLHDIYPFVLSPAVIGKLSFIHRLVHA